MEVDLAMENVRRTSFVQLQSGKVVVTPMVAVQVDRETMKA